MKKILCIALAMTMVLGMLAGCSDKKNDEESSKPDTTVSDNSSSSNSSSEETSKPESSEPVESETETVTVKSNNERLAYIIDSVRDEESKKTFKAETTNDNGALDMLTLTEEDVAEYSLTFSQLNVHAYMIAVIKPAEGKEEVVKTALTNYQQAIAKSFEQYLPDQFDIASKAVIFEHEGYMGLVMCAESDTVETQLKEALSNITDIQVVEETVVPEKPEVTDTEKTDGTTSNSSDTSSSNSTNSTVENSAAVGKDTEANKDTKNTVSSVVKAGTEAGKVTE